MIDDIQRELTRLRRDFALVESALDGLKRVIAKMGVMLDEQQRLIKELAILHEKSAGEP